MQTNNYLEQGKSFLKKNASRIALRAMPLALLAVGVAHAGSGSLGFLSPSSTSVSGCSGGGSVVSALTGSPTHNGLGLSLSGTGSLSSPGQNSACSLTLMWSGTGSGAFPGTGATVSSSFTLSTPLNVSLNSCTITVKINGATVATATPTCTHSGQQTQGYRGFGPRYSNTTVTVNLSPLAFSVPATLTSWEVDLVVNATWVDGTPTLLSVIVPGNTSIDLLAQLSTVPALSPLAFIMTGILLLSLAGFGLLRRTSAGQGSPGQPS